MTSTIAENLGIMHAGSPLDIIEAIRKGLKRETVDYVARVLEVNASEMSRFLHVSPRTLHRYKPGEVLSPDTSDHLVQVYRVYMRALDVFTDDKKALRWLKYPSLALGNISPFELLDTSAGVEMVLDELGRIEHGIFA